MARTRSFTTANAVRAARDQFWEHGYEATSLADLERVTGLNRSSIYQAFGSKHQLFSLAVESYLAEVAAPRLAALEAPGAGIAQVVEYLESLAAVMADAPGSLAGRGCLVVNTITERAGHDPEAHAVGVAYRDRLLRAFAGALPPETAAHRAELLTGAVIAVLVTARLAPAAAATLARAAAMEARSWR
ncbi:TetR/AcrR family transcriptional regulator [Couchioplanes caeruleus]|uniref:Transcriptional regulator n=2 Tax=Couchioplanes caeruleus TaxID=56438 RepID=A0A1K0GWR0_9ACTN|nr:TetR/AcrR family transcriptional regulator [Couchioplanes caeruleus]OJF15828.1 transcriptional regulator [Couchioplanes caeruleus subsp. caeruleus]ROP33785.1 TetR family transcriptional regulator [Couchioplanes caeruleus]